MKRNIKILMLPFKEGVFYWVTALVIVIILLIASVSLINKVPLELQKSKYVSSHDLYIVNNSYKDASFEKVQNLDETKQAENSELNYLSVDYELSDSNILGFKGISSTLIIKLNKIDPLHFQFKLYPIYVNSDVPVYKFPIPSLEIENLIVGKYPQTPNDILIGELEAINYMQLNDISSFDDIIGKSIEITVDGKTYTYNICGVVNGSTDFYVTNTNELFSDYIPSEYSSYYKFDSRNDKEDYIKNNLKPRNIEYYDSENYNQIGKNIQISMTSLLIANFIYILILFIPYKRIFKILSNYRSTKSKYLILVFPFVAMIIIDIIYLMLVL